MSGRDCGLAPWELQYIEAKKHQQYRTKEQTHNTRGQWLKLGRRVFALDKEAAKVIVTRNGHQLHLFGHEQTQAADHE